MRASVAIGEFSRLTHLTIKSLRHYHEQGLLVPYAVDEPTGYRRYSIDQVVDALLIGRLRALDMPLAEIRRVVDSASPTERDAAIADHLSRMERELDRTRGIVASLRDLLRPVVVPEVTHRVIEGMVAVAATERVGREEIGDWCGETFTKLYQGLLGIGGTPAGPGGAFYSEEFFTEAAGEVTAYVPVGGPSTSSGHMIIPGGRYAIAVHAGPFIDFDRTYAALGSHVAAHDTANPGPIREIYLVGPPDATDEASYRTEVCWPIAPNHERK